MFANLAPRARRLFHGLLILLVTLLICCIVCLILLFQANSSIQRGDEGRGSLVVEVVDGFSGEALSQATVTVLETGDRANTQSDGRTAPLSLPIRKNHALDGLLEQTWGEVTLVIEKPGYAPYILFHAQVYPDQMRYGPQIMLFKTSDVPSAQPFSVIESPNAGWVEELLRAFHAQQQEKSSMESSVDHA